MRSATWLDVGRPAQKADAVVLLGGSYNTRPFVAAALVRGGWAPKVLLNTVLPHPLQVAGAVPPWHKIAQRILAYGGVTPNQLIVLDTSAQTTFDEAAGVSAYLDKHPARRLLLVTEGPHTRRSEWIFRRVLARHHVEVSSVSAPAEDFDSAVWWGSQEGFIFVVSEYLKLAFYAVRYGWLGYEILAAAVMVVALRAWIWRRRKPSITMGGEANPSSGLAGRWSP